MKTIMLWDLWALFIQEGTSTIKNTFIAIFIHGWWMRPIEYNHLPNYQCEKKQWLNFLKESGCI